MIDKFGIHYGCSGNVSLFGTSSVLLCEKIKKERTGIKMYKYFCNFVIYREILGPKEQF